MFFLHNNNSSNKIIIIEIIYIYIFLRRIKERFFATDQIKRKISAETGCKISYRQIVPVLNPVAELKNILIKGLGNRTTW